MNNKKFKQKIYKVLKSDSRLWNEEKKEFNQTLLLDLVDKIDEKIINLLLQKKELRENFFIKIKDVYVFKTDEFKFFIEENKLDNSYTQYENKIGLSAGKKFLNYSDDVVLDFPYKDCVLQGGQTTEDGTDTYFEFDKKTENYEQKKAKRKEIFFNQVLAKDEIDRLLDEKALVNWKRYTKDGETSVKEIARNENGTIKENLIIKGNNLLALHSLEKQFAGKVQLIYIDPPYNTGNDEFKYNDNFSHSTWLTFIKNRLEIAKELLRDDGSIYIQLDYNEVHYFKVLMDEIFGGNNFQREIIWDMTVLSGYKTLAKNWIRGHDSILFYTKNANSFKFNKLKQPHTKKYEKMFNRVDKNGRKYLVAHGSTRYWDEIKDKGKPYGDVWNDIMSFQQQPTSGERMDFDGQKPEKLLERIILSATDKGDIVLDFFGGTGTTASVALKLQRQAITIEQMDYIDNKLKKRLIETVVGTHNSVLSKSIKWKGGGSFIYLELAKWNEKAKEIILESKNLKELINFFNEMYEKYFLNYNFKIKEFKEKVIKEEEFKKLSLAEQKKMFIKMLDNNQLYINKSEMLDKKFKISQKDQELTKEFYGS